MNRYTERFFLIIYITMFIACTKPVSREPVFTDVTEKAGIKFIHTDGSSGNYYFVEELGSGVAFFDYDNDGYLDIYFVNGADLPGAHSDKPPTNILYRNNSDGTFSDVTEQVGVGDTSYGVGCCVGDFDNDGYLDLYVTNFGKNVLYHNNGDGTFSDITDQAGVGDIRWGAGCSFGDFNQDGFVDLYVANYAQYSLSKDRDCYQNGIRTNCTPQMFLGEDNILYENNGNGTFSDITVQAGVMNPRGRGMGVVTADYDNDGDLDIYIANDMTENALFRNNSDGTFNDQAFYAGVALIEHGETGAGMGVDISDYNNDGFLDIIVTNFQDQPVSLFKNEGNGFFKDESYISGLGEKTLSTLGWGVSFFDYDNDGFKDIFLVNGHVYSNVELFDSTTSYAQPNQLFKNLGDGTFQEVTNQTGKDLLQKAPSRGAAFGDYDNDGDMDILVTNKNGRPQLLRNDGGNRNNWIKIKVIGTTSNRAGIGTRIKIVTEGKSQIADVKSGTSYLSQNDLMLHFGLGSNKIIDKVITTFPGGKKHEIQDILVNQVIEIIEPDDE